MTDHKVLAFDPGGSSGWALCTFDDDDYKFDGGTLQIDDHHQQLRDLITNCHPDIVIYEAFEFRQKAHSDYRKGLNLISREYIGVIRLTCQDLHITTRQQPAAYKDTNLVREANLEKLGILRRPLYPNRHYHDAAAHLVHYMIQTLRYQPVFDVVKKKIKTQ